MLILILILIIYIFNGVKDYYNYNINNILGALEENRGYIIENPDIPIIKTLKNSDFIEKIENYNVNEKNNYYVLLRYYKDRDNFFKYLDSKNINYYLFDSSKKAEIDIMKDALSSYDLIIKISSLVFLVAIFLLFKNIIINENKNTAILKVFGYSSIRISFLLFLRLFLLLFISVLLSMLILYLFHFTYLLINDINLREYLKCLNYKSFLYINMYSFLPLFMSIFLNNLKLRKANLLKNIND